MAWRIEAAALGPGGGGAGGTAGVAMVCQRGWYSSTDFWSPQLFDRLVFPSVCRLSEVAHRHGKKYAYVITTGLKQIGPRLADAGVDLLYFVDPIQDKLTLEDAEQHVHAAAFAAASWFEDYLVLDLLEECSLPVLLWALPGMETGALCGCQQLTAFLEQLGTPYRAVYGPLEPGAAARRAGEYLRAAALRARLRRARVGLLGHRVPGMTETAPSEFALKKALGQPTRNTDWLEPLEDGRVVFTHCGSGSFSLAERAGDIRLESVRLMGQGVCALFPARPGPVTLLSLLPRGDGSQVAVLEGEALSSPMVFPGNPLRVRFPQAVAELIDWVFDTGIGHHWMAGCGHVGATVVQWAKLCGPPVRMLTPGGCGN